MLQIPEGQLKWFKQNREYGLTHLLGRLGTQTTLGTESHWYHQGCSPFFFSRLCFSLGICPQTIAFLHMTKENGDKKPWLSLSWAPGVGTISSQCRHLHLADRLAALSPGTGLGTWSFSTHPLVDFLFKSCSGWQQTADSKVLPQTCTL